MKSLFILLFAALCSQMTIAQNKQVIPEKPKAAFAKSYPDATNAKWDKENGQYEVSFRYRGKAMSVVYAANGSMSETETAIEQSALPQPALKYASAKGTIKEAAKIVKADGTVLFEAEVNGTDLLFNEKGDFVAQKKETK